MWTTIRNKSPRTEPIINTSPSTPSFGLFNLIDSATLLLLSFVEDFVLISNKVISPQQKVDDDENNNWEIKHLAI